MYDRQTEHGWERISCSIDQVHAVARTERVGSSCSKRRKCKCRNFGASIKVYKTHIQFTIERVHMQY